MLAALPKVSAISIGNGQSRIHSLIRAPLFVINVFSDGGQGPEKPPIVEEVDSGEEIFTFDYPERGGEISDLVNHPIEGIAGKAYSVPIKANVPLRSIRTFSDGISYLFINPKMEGSIYAAGHEFVSLTRQLTIASSYTGLLVYIGYVGSNTNFSYTSDPPYESSPSPRQEIYLMADNPLYETRFPIPMLFGRVYYQHQGKDGVDVMPLTRSKLQAYQNTIQEPINFEPPKLYVNDTSDQEFGVNPDLNVGTKLDYKTSGLELPVMDTNLKLNVNPDYKVLELRLPLAKTELPVLDVNSEVSETKPVASFLPGLSYPKEDLTVNVTRPRLDTAHVPNYDTKTQVKCVAVNDVVNLPINLGFDDPLLRDRFIARLNAQVIEAEHRSITVSNQVTTSDSRLPAETYIPPTNGVMTQEATLPKFTDFSFFPIRLVLDLGNNMDYVLDRENMCPYELQSPVLRDNNALDRVNVGHRVSEKDNENKPATPQASYDFAQLGFTLGQPTMRQIAHVGILIAVEYEPPLLGFDDPLLIKTVISISHDTPQIYSIRSPTAKRGELQVEPIGNTTSNVGYDARSLDFDLEFSDDKPITCYRAGVALDPYGLFSLGNPKIQGNYQDNVTVRSILLHSQDRTSARNSLDNLVGVAYYSGRVNSLPTTNPFSTNYVLVPFDLDVQQDSTTTTVNNPDYEGISPEQDLEEVVNQEQELTEQKNDPTVQTENYDGIKNNPKGEAHEEKEPNAKNETEDSSAFYVATAVAAIGGGLLAALTAPLTLFKKGDNHKPKDKEEILEEESKTKKRNPEESYASKKCMPTSAEANEKEISDFAEKTELYDGPTITSKKFCFKKITEDEQGYVAIDGVKYKARATLTVDQEFIQKISKDPKKTIIGIRGKNGGDLTSQYEVSNKSIIALLYAQAMDEAENGGKGLTLDVRLDRNLERYETLREGKLMVRGVFGLDDYDSQYVVQLVERDEQGRVKKRFFPKDNKGNFLSVDQGLPPNYSKYDVQLVRLEQEGEKEWEKEINILKRLAEINQDPERVLGEGRYAPKLFELRDEDGEVIKGAYALLEMPLQITAEDIAQEGIYFVGSDRAVDRDEKSTHVALKNDGLLAILDRKIQEHEGLEAIYKAMPTQKNRQLLKDNEVFMKAIKGAYEQYQKLHPYVPQERLTLLIVEVDPLTGQLSEPGYDPNTGLQFRPTAGKHYQFIVGDGKDISKARINISPPNYKGAEQVEERILEPTLSQG